MTVLEGRAAVETAPLAVAPPRRRSTIRRIAADRTAVAGAVLLLLIVAAVLGAPWLATSDPTAVDTSQGLAHSSSEHPLGTDQIGRDMLSRVLHGGRTSIGTALAATVAITILGVVMGVWSGMSGGVVDSLIMRTVDVLQALPLLILAMLVVGLFGGGTHKLVLAVALLGWAGYARVVRASTLSIRERDFVAAARAQGASRVWIMRRHIVPNVLGVVSALSMIDLGRIVLVLSSLSFLGFGVRPPNPEWGAMVADTRGAFYLAPRLLMYPGVAISLLVVAVNLLGDGLRDVIDRKGGRL